MSKDLMELVEGCPAYETDVLKAKGEEVISEYRELGFVKATEEVHQKNLDISKRQKIYEFEYRVITTETIRKFLQRKVKLYDKEHKPKPKKKIPVAGTSILADDMREALANRDWIHTSIVELAEPQQGDVFDISALERMREELIRSHAVPTPLMGIVGELRSDQRAIHRRLREAHQQRLEFDAYIGAFSTTELAPLGEAYNIYEKTCDYDKFDSETIGRFEWKEERVEDYEGLPPAPVIKTFKEHKARKVFDYFTIASVNSVPDPLLLGRIDGDDDNRWFIANWGTDVCLDDLI